MRIRPYRCLCVLALRVYSSDLSREVGTVKEKPGAIGKRIGVSAVGIVRIGIGGHCAGRTLASFATWFSPSQTELVPSCDLVVVQEPVLCGGDVSQSSSCGPRDVAMGGRARAVECPPITMLVDSR